MEKTETDATEEVARLYDRYGAMLFRMCMVTLGNRQDAEDAVQDTFAKYLKTQPSFREVEHEKAWFLRVAENCCMDKRRTAFFRRTVSLEQLGNTPRRRRNRRHFPSLRNCRRAAGRSFISTM